MLPVLASTLSSVFSGAASGQASADTITLDAGPQTATTGAGAMSLGGSDPWLLIVVALGLVLVLRR